LRIQAGDRFWRGCQEQACTATRLEHASTLETKAENRRPHSPNDEFRGEMGVLGCPHEFGFLFCRDQVLKVRNDFFPSALSRITAVAEGNFVRAQNY
jgi:hypothetical protein